MTNDFDLNDAINLTDAAKLIRGQNGKRAHVETVRRYCNPKRGVRPRGKDGPQIILRSVKINGEILTTRAWVEEFLRQRTRVGQRQPEPPIARPEGRRLAAHRRATERLEELGI